MANTTPLFSFIIPVYNVEKYLNQCVDSILNQEYKNFEVILVDDGSKDNSGKICDEYVNKDERVRVFHKENGGVSVARNYGIQKATGKYILFVDSDDYIESNSLTQLANTVEKEEYDLIFLKGYKIYDNEKLQALDGDIKFDGLKTREEILKYISKLSKFPGSACTKVINKQLIDEYKIYFEEKRVSLEDVEVIIKILKVANKMTSINSPYYFYRQNRVGSTTNSLKAENINSMIDVIKRYAEKKPKSGSSICINNFLAYEYIILLADYMSLCKSEKNKVNVNVFEYKWILRYNNNSKVKIVYLIQLILGIKITSWILFKFLIYKDRKWEVSL